MRFALLAGNGPGCLLLTGIAGTATRHCRPVRPFNWPSPNVLHVLGTPVRLDPNSERALQHLALVVVSQFPRYVTFSASTPTLIERGSGDVLPGDVEGHL